MRIWPKATLITFTLSLLLVSYRLCEAPSPLSYPKVSGGIEEVRVELQLAYNATVNAERAGAEVSEAVDKLNNALFYINQTETLLAKGDFEQANTSATYAIQLSEETLTLSQNLKAQAEAWSSIRLTITVVAAVVLVGLLVFAFFYGRRILRRHQEKRFLEMRVKTSSGNPVNTSQEIGTHQKVDEERIIIVAVLSALVVIAGLLVYVSLVPAQPENFVSIYLLNSEKSANNYPQVLMLGRNNTFMLWIGVENFMGRIEYCSVHVEITNDTVPTTPQPEVIVRNYEKILLKTKTWEFPVILTLNKTGFYRITFELWLYNEVKSVFANSNSKSALRLKVVSLT
jgi:hypothetical protein